MIVTAPEKAGGTGSKCDRVDFRIGTSAASSFDEVCARCLAEVGVCRVQFFASKLPRRRAKLGAVKRFANWDCRFKAVEPS